MKKYITALELINSIQEMEEKITKLQGYDAIYLVSDEKSSITVDTCQALLTVAKSSDVQVKKYASVETLTFLVGTLLNKEDTFVLEDGILPKQDFILKECPDIKITITDGVKKSTRGRRKGSKTKVTPQAETVTLEEKAPLPSKTVKVIKEPIALAVEKVETVKPRKPRTPRTKEIVEDTSKTILTESKTNKVELAMNPPKEPIKASKTPNTASKQGIKITSVIETDMPVKMKTYIGQMSVRTTDLDHYEGDNTDLAKEIAVILAAQAEKEKAKEQIITHFGEKNGEVVWKWIAPNMKKLCETAKDIL